MSRFPLPCWYVPAGAPHPAHVPRISPQQLAAGGGPDHSGGMAWGGPFDPAGEWMESAAGWWFDRSTIAPERTLRTNAIPGHQVGGWLVPVVLRYDHSPAVGYWDATGFRVPAPWDSLVERLRPAVRYVGTVVADHAQLAADLIGANHHVTMHELGAIQVLTPTFVVAVINAAAGVTPEILAAAEKTLAEP